MSRDLRTENQKLRLQNTPQTLLHNISKAVKIFEKSPIHLKYHMSMDQIIQNS